MSVDFSRVRIHTLWLVLLGWVLAVWSSPGLQMGTSLEWDWVIAGLLLDAAMFFWVWRACRRAGTTVPALIGPTPAAASWRKLTLAPVVLAVSIGCFWLLWFPLSYVWPEFVQFWALDEVAFWDPEHPGPSAVNILSAVVFVPIWEEALFRGVLLHALCFRWGRWPALLVSSLVFGILHADPLGAFVFGLVMGLLYVVTGSLWLSIACHALNNAIVAALEFTPVFDPDFTVAEFQDQWPIGLAGLLLGSIALWAMRRSYLPPTDWSLPQPAPLRG